MDKITVVCHKDHDKGYEDFQGKCLLCVVEDLMREVGRLTAVCKEKEWVGLTPQEFNEIKDNSTTIGYAILQTEAKLKEKNA